MERLLLKRNERGSMVPFVALFAGLAVSNAVLNIIHTTELSKAHDELRQNEQEIQVYHDQVATQLTGDFKNIEHLALVSRDGSLTFKALAADGRPETCNGSYEVAGSTASVVGNIACTQTDTIKITQ